MKGQLVNAFYRIMWKSEVYDFHSVANETERCISSRKSFQELFFFKLFNYQDDVDRDLL